MLIYRSCGVLVFRKQPETSFLLMEHANRWDIPKGHVDEGESDRQCALRELWEETGVTEGDLDLDDDFRFELKYNVRYRRDGGQAGRKTLIVFLGILKRDMSINPTEHQGFRWIRWGPPHHIQENTIDPLLAAVAERGPLELRPDKG